MQQRTCWQRVITLHIDQGLGLSASLVFSQNARWAAEGLQRGCKTGSQQAQKQDTDANAHCYCLLRTNKIMVVRRREATVTIVKLGFKPGSCIAVADNACLQSHE